MIPTSARYDIPFSVFRSNTTGTENWKRLTTQRFLDGLDLHLDRLLAEYRTMLNMMIRVVESVRDSDEIAKQDIASKIKTAFPYVEASTSEGDLRHQIEDGPVFADELFADWRELGEAELLALCREHFDRLLAEHDHMSASLASTVNRIGDTPGWGHWRPEDIRVHLYGQLIWRWPTS